LTGDRQIRLEPIFGLSDSGPCHFYSYRTLRLVNYSLRPLDVSTLAGLGFIRVGVPPRGQLADFLCSPVFILLDIFFQPTHTRALAFNPHITQAVLVRPRDFTKAGPPECQAGQEVVVLMGAECELVPRVPLFDSPPSLSSTMTLLPSPPQRVVQQYSMYLRPRFRRVPSYAGIDDACSELLDNLDPELLVPLDLPSDVPFKPRLTEIKVQLFLRAMLKCAPLFGRPYVVKNVLATRGAEAELQGLAGVWFNRIIFLGALSPCFWSHLTWSKSLTWTRLVITVARALYLPARPPDQPEGVHVDPLEDSRLDAFHDRVRSFHNTALPDLKLLTPAVLLPDVNKQLRKRDGWHTTITRQADGQHPIPAKANNGVQTSPINIVPKITSLRTVSNFPMSFHHSSASLCYHHVLTCNSIGER
jgi:hypothetical protein